MNIPFSPVKKINLKQRSFKFLKRIKIISKRFINNDKNTKEEKLKRTFK